MHLFHDALWSLRHGNGAEFVAAIVSAVILLSFGVACRGTSAHVPGVTPTVAPIPADLTGGILATFDVNDEEFKVWVTNPFSIQAVLRVQGRTSTAFIPNGRILRGPGQANHNAPWSWHLDPEDFGMDHLTLPECNVAPSFVETHLDAFMGSDQRFCPWVAKLVGVQIYSPFRSY